MGAGAGVTARGGCWLLAPARTGPTRWRRARGGAGRAARARGADAGQLRRRARVRGLHALGRVPVRRRGVAVHHERVPDRLGPGQGRAEAHARTAGGRGRRVRAARARARRGRACIPRCIAPTVRRLWMCMCCVGPFSVGHVHSPRAARLVGQLRIPTWLAARVPPCCASEPLSARVGAVAGTTSVHTVTRPRASASGAAPPWRRTTCAFWCRGCTGRTTRRRRKVPRHNGARAARTNHFLGHAPRATEAAAHSAHARATTACARAPTARACDTTGTSARPPSPPAPPCACSSGT